MEIADTLPWALSVTEYDRAHYPVYLRLLDADADGASTEAMAQVVLGIDPAREPDRARKVAAIHLRRARWLVKNYHRLLQKDAS